MLFRIRLIPQPVSAGYTVPSCLGSHARARGCMSRSSRFIVTLINLTDTSLGTCMYSFLRMNRQHKYL